MRIIRQSQLMDHQLNDLHLSHCLCQQNPLCPNKTPETPLSLEEAINLAESIDQDVAQTMIRSNYQLKCQSPFPFSSTLAKSCLAITILKLHQTFRKDKPISLDRLQAHGKESVLLPNTIEETTNVYIG